MPTKVILATLIFATCLPAQSNAQAASSSRPVQQAQDPQPSGNDPQRSSQTEHQDAAFTTEPFSARVMDSLLRVLKQGMEGHNPQQFLSAFDRGQMDGYLVLADQIQEFFRRYDNFRIHYRIIQDTMEGSKGIALVEFQMEAIPRSEGESPSRRDQQIRFEVARGKSGWKVVDLSPREFFEP